MATDGQVVFKGRRGLNYAGVPMRARRICRFELFARYRRTVDDKWRSLCRCSRGVCICQSAADAVVFEVYLLCRLFTRRQYVLDVAAIPAYGCVVSCPSGAWFEMPDRGKEWRQGLANSKTTWLLSEYKIDDDKFVHAISKRVYFFTALHGMQTRSYDENYVPPSVNRVHCDKTEEKSVQIFIPCERVFSLVFLEKNGWWGGRLLLPYLDFGSTGPRWSEIADFEPIIARSASAVIPAKKFNRKSPTRVPMTLR